MTKRSYIVLAAAASLAAGTRPAAAQNDVNPPAPNVMLLVDTSGSMEYRSSEQKFPVCDPTGATASERSRWIETIEVLTGSIQDYRCQAVARNSSAFRDEYALANNSPYDFEYENPYHRPLSGTCTPGPGSLPTNVYDFPADAIKFHEYTNPTLTCSSFSQANDGVLDAFATGTRFGLMTFDTLPNAGTGVSGNAANYATGIAGGWSYFLGAQNKGWPAGCDPNLAPDTEVGARNAAAPPWEGRMVAFGSPTASASVLTAKNEQIQKILLASRPYGATPIAGMLHDARDFFWNDSSNDPTGGGGKFGPKDDPFVTGGCRKQAILLLTDGQPNLDLRPFCEGKGPPAGKCPYDKPEEIASNLANATQKRVKTFVVGFAIEDVTVNGAPVDCNDLVPADEKLAPSDVIDSTGLCAQNPDEKALQVCCTLHRIAYNGGTRRAHFASTAEDLRNAVAAVLTEDQHSTSRTHPVIGSAVNVRDDFAGGFRFFSSFQPIPFEVWHGVLERQRIVCESEDNGPLVPKLKDTDQDMGDDFAANVNSGLGDARRFVTILREEVGGQIFSQRSIRPVTADPDGVASVTGEVVSGEAASFTNAVVPPAMAIDGTTCAGMTAAQCRDKYMLWNVGLDNGLGPHRCKTPGSATCSLVGDIFHSTPQVVGRPLEFLRDESYQLFAAQQQKRPIVLYTSTNDGFLHAFKVAPETEFDTVAKTLRNNELWAFIPPAVLPTIPSQYPGTHQLLLDGTPVIKDVVAKAANNSFVFERTLSDAQNGSGTWRTVLVQSFGGARGGYFALDITEPAFKPDGTGGPRFLWQLTQDGAGNPLFGLRGATPLITTLFFDVGNEEVREVPVAVLPGGAGGAATGAACPRQNPTPDNVDPGFSPRGQVNCYPNLGKEGRSLTIVRLDTGEIIRTFRRSAADAPAGLAGRVVTADLDSPITGQPVAFPSETGAVADRIFVGDADGTLWKVDLSSSNPDNWTMRLFFDTYPTDLTHDFDDGQPIATSPVLSVDESGNVTIALSTGDQEVLTQVTGMKTYVWSLTEKPSSDGTKLESRANWYLTLVDGERVAGPISLFSRALFFSTFTPASPADACGVGTSAVWGMDYLIASLEGAGNGGLPRLPDRDNPTEMIQRLTATDLVAGDATNVTIFGVAVAQLPSCNTADEENFNDPFLGFGKHVSVGGVTPGTFQLVMQTGSGGSSLAGGITNVQTVDLPPPPSASRIDSWAGIIE